MAPSKDQIVFFGDFHLENQKFEIETDDFFSGQSLFVGNLEGILNCEFEPDVRLASPKIMQNSKLQSHDFFHRVFWGLANNHIMDFGKKGAALTGQALGESAFGFASDKFDGVEASILRTSVSGHPVAVIFVNEFSQLQCDAWIGSDGSWVDLAITQEVQERNSFIVVYFHGGVEGSQVPGNHTRERFQQFIDAGASAVLSHHPHVLGITETYRGALLDYGLGNFIVDPSKWSRFHHSSCISRAYKLTDVDGKLELQPRLYEVKDFSGTTKVKALDKTDENRINEHLTGVSESLENESLRSQVDEALAEFYWDYLALKNVSIGALLSSKSLRLIAKMIFGKTRFSGALSREYLTDIFEKPSNRTMALKGYSARLRSSAKASDSARDWILDNKLVSDEICRSAKKRKGRKH